MHNGNDRVRLLLFWDGLFWGLLKKATRLGLGKSDALAPSLPQSVRRAQGTFFSFIHSKTKRRKPYGYEEGIGSTKKCERASERALSVCILEILIEPRHAPSAGVRVGQGREGVVRPVGSDYRVALFVGDLNC